MNKHAHMYVRYRRRRPLSPIQVTGVEEENMRRRARSVMRIIALDVLAPIQVTGVEEEKKEDGKDRVVVDAEEQEGFKVSAVVSAVVLCATHVAIRIRGRTRSIEPLRESTLCLPAHNACCCGTHIGRKGGQRGT